MQKGSGLKRKTNLKKTRKPPKKKDPESVSVLKKIADDVTSLYVVYRDGEKRADGWWSQCITCDKWVKLQFKKDGSFDRRPIHWGHFQSSRHNMTRYDERNVNAQCQACNIHNQGEQYKYSLALPLKYGDGVVEELVSLAKIHHPFKSDELHSIIDRFQKEIDFYESLA